MGFNFGKGIYLAIFVGSIAILLVLRTLVKKRKELAKLRSGIESSVEAKIKPIFSSSFIQYWFCENWNRDRWIDELTMLRNIGINEIILQEIANTKDKYAVYPTKIAGYTCSDIDMVGTVLDAADSLGMKVRIGLGFNSRWWVMNAYSKRWLSLEAKVNKTIVNEIIEMYGSYSSFAGWYIPHEFYQLSALTRRQQFYLNSFFKEITFEIKKRSTKDIMIAPFYYGKFFFIGSMKAWAKSLENILKGTEIDIVALQDSIGAGFNKIRQLDNLFAYTKRATDRVGMKLYADIETFKVESSKFASASQDRIAEQISIAGKYVEGFVAFSVNHYQNTNVAAQEVDYNKYLHYYLDNK